ncbi:MAG TPA: aminotransferase class V-fold PLP-dependent enzyme [Nitrospirota bacterium]|nr:aminotransferase class V-fold PLP-dependent enzyme [Nitrospirota bacterium]
MRRTLPPAAAPLKMTDLLNGLRGLMKPGHCSQDLKQELKDYFGVKHVYLVSSGKAALTMILLALKSLSPGRRRVVIPAYTCFSVPSAIVKAGLEVALCDVDRVRYDYDYQRLHRVVDDDTLCVISGNLFGIPSDISKIIEICKERGASVVEDAAQAMGCTCNERLIGTIADAGFYSLGRGKNITCGSGGILVTNSDGIASVLEKIYGQIEEPRLFEDVTEFVKAIFMALFIHPSLYWLPAGLPFLKLGETIFYRDFPVQRLSGMKAGMMRNWRNRLAAYNRTRAENAEYYRNAIGTCGVASGSVQQGMSSIKASLRFPILANTREARDNIISAAAAQGLGISRMYPTPINMIDEIKESFVGQTYPAAAEMADCLFTIPIHPLLRERDKRKTSALLCEMIKAPVCSRGKSGRSAPRG